jgi:hypothetical protein
MKQTRAMKILAMVYNIQNYWVSGLRPSSGNLKTIEHNVKEIGSVSVLRWRVGKHLFCLVSKKDLTSVIVIEASFL